MDSELRKCPARNKRPRDSHDEIANEAEAGALNDLAGKAAGDDADNQYNEETFAGYVHLCVLHDRTVRRRRRQRFSE
jgi:hypothetical protein